MNAAHAGIQLAVIVGGQGDPLGANGLGDEFDFDLFLLGDKDDGVALDDGLAAQCPALVDLGRRQAHAAVVADCAMLDPHLTAATPPLTAAGQVKSHAGLHSGIGQQGANLNLDHLARGLEDDDGLFIAAGGPVPS